MAFITSRLCPHPIVLFQAFKNAKEMKGASVFSLLKELPIKTT